jgi:hypothetical protein
MRRVSSWLLLITLCVGCYHAQEDMRAEKARNDAIANDLKELGLKMHAEQQAVEPESDTKPEPETTPEDASSAAEKPPE